MKAKLDFRSKRTIIIAAIIAALAVGAGIGAYFYAKGNNEASASTEISDAGQTATEQAPTGENNQSNPDSNANNGNENENVSSELEIPEEYTNFTNCVNCILDPGKCQVFEDNSN